MSVIDRIAHVILQPLLGSCEAKAREQSRFAVQRGCRQPPYLGDSFDNAGGAHPPAMPNGFSRPMARLRHISNLGVTAALPPSIAKSWPNDAGFGGRSRARPWPRQERAQCRRPPLSSVIV